MKARVTRQSQKIMVSLALILLAALCLAPAAAEAGAAKALTAKYKATFSGPKPTRILVADDPAHYLEISKRTGTAVFSDGKKASFQAVMSWDVHLGWFAKGTGYSKLTFKDGSWVVVQWQAKWTGFDKTGNPLFKGSGTLVNGSGPYLGIKGTMSFTGMMLPASKDHPTGLSQRDAVWSYTLPTK